MLLKSSLLIPVFLLLALLGCSRSAKPLPESVLERAGSTASQPAALDRNAAGEGSFLSPTTSPLPSPTPPPTPTAPPAERLEMAREADRIGDWARAFPLYESLRGEPELAGTALFFLGELYLREERVVEAVAAWQEALLREPEGEYAAAIRYRLALGLARIGQHASAIAMWEELDANDDRVDDVLAQRLADSYQTLGNAQAAAAQWERIYEMDGAPRISRALAARDIATWHAEQARWQEAYDWYERALGLSQVHDFRSGLIAKMAQMALQSGNDSTAQAHWRLLVQAYPSTPEALAAAARLAERGEPLSHLEMAELYLANERWSEAARAYFNSLEQEEDRAESHAEAARALEAAGNYAGALQQWQEILTSHSEATALQDDALFGTGHAQAHLGRLDEALASWQQVVESYPESNAAPLALWERALSLRDGLADPTAAAGTFEQLATRYPGDSNAGEALWQAGLLRFRGGEMEKARENFTRLAERAGELRPTRALFWAGKTARALGDEAGARRFWEQAAEQGTDYYALRANALLQGIGWKPRAELSFDFPVEEDMEWLRAAAQLAPGADLNQLPEEPLLERGHFLLLSGEREAARQSFLDAIQTHSEEPQALWALSRHFAAQNLPNYSIYAARRLMELLGYNELTAPIPLARLAYPIPYADQLRATAEHYQVDPLLFAALIYQESRWEPRARSHAAARGLTQVIPDTGQWIAQRLNDPNYSYSKLDRPVISLHYGGYYIDYVLGLFDDNPFYALAAYNGGPGNARRWTTTDDDLFVENIHLRETRSYIELIYQHWHAYERIYGQQRP